MSQRKQKYTTEQLIDELLKMDAQIIHGSDIFKQCAEQLSQLRTDFEKAMKFIKGCIEHPTSGDQFFDKDELEEALSTPSAMEYLKRK